MMQKAAGRLLAALASMAVAGGMFAAPAVAEEPNIYGLVTPDEEQEIWANGWQNCAKIDQYADAGDQSMAIVQGVIQQYLDSGWDLESAGDIVWESVEGRCAEYLPQVKRAMRAYGPMD